MSDELLASISELAAAYAEGRLSPVEVTTETLGRIAVMDDQLHSYLEIRRDDALADARRLEAELRQGRTRGPLHGVPVAFKDLIDVEGMRTTGGSFLRRDNVPGADADVVATMKAAGAIVIGKNNLYEFGLGLPTDGEWPEAATNPWDTSRIPGGSSSGSAVAVVTGLCAGSFGTDTGGSIRGPASYCGVVGLKPTSGLISATGCMALSWTLDHVGPMARTVDDVGALLAAASGTAVEITEGIDGVRIGVPRTLIDRLEIEPDVRTAFEDVLGTFQRLGAVLIEVELPDLEVTEATLLAIIGSEGLAAHLPTLGPQPEAYGRSARERLTAGLIYSAVDYVNALRVRDRVTAAMDALYRDVDVIASPVTLQVAPRNVDFQRNPPHRTPFTGVHNLTGGPAVSVPGGFDRERMPIGFQLAGPPGSDAQVLSVARAYEREFPWHTTIPPVLEAIVQP